ncbi:type IV pilin protein [Actimicrobium sp. CCC2.4]|uniref:type IV pilin protein n=1 Tax=Actimicrobium sp. CCC2.4 TaxID=3048606 RepID=UPI002AC9610A|nr:type IV pilin protein [Actimicrobium sp. CCC2.4]MEB0137306.1 type IV pilin protein [Actimicrobium sp. CCC2.4]WPX31803.1 type IV pilin protein [Actimicrobium sp. CCC2.4]
MPNPLCGRTGFTLIELLVAIVIVALLATIALPSYQFAVRKVKRAEGRAALLRLMQQQEQLYSQRMTYLAFSSSSTAPDQQRFAWFSAESAAASAYEIDALACPGRRIAECVLLRARPGTNRVNAGFSDPQCGILRLDSLGHKDADGRNCW